MKRIFFVYLLGVLFLTAPATGRAERPWGVLVEVVEDTTFSTYAVDYLIKKQPIRYAVATGITPEEEAVFKAHISKWPAETLRFIEQSGREAEFEDIVPILKHKLKLVKVSEQDAPDIVFRFSDKLRPGTLGRFQERNEKTLFNTIEIAEGQRADFAATLLHELGHFYGLSDQYESAQINSHAEYSSDRNYDDKSVMWDNSFTDAQLTCDDADGFINLIDLRLAQRANGNFSPRPQKGWKSFCANSTNRYQEARTINRQEMDVVSDRSDFELVYLREYKNGKLQQTTELVVMSPMDVFSVSDGDQVERDPDTSLIKSIRSTLDRPVSLADGTTVTKEMPYERNFEYIFLSGEEVKIWITEKINGKTFHGYSIHARPDQTISWTGSWDFRLTNEDFSASTKNLTVNFHSDHYSINHTFIGKLEGKFSESTARVTLNGKTESITLPPPEKDYSSYALWGIMVINAQALKSYSYNFYEPLFGTKKASEEAAAQVHSQVQQALAQ